MKKSNVKPLLYTVGVAVLFVVLILLLPRVKEVGSVSKKPERKSIEPRLENVISIAREKLDGALLTRLATLENELDSAKTDLAKAALLDSMAFLWSYANRPDISSEYLWMAAEKRNDAETWFMVGDSYFNSFTQIDDTLKEYAIKRSIDAYQNVLDLQPGNLRALNAMGVAFVEGSSVTGEPPMRGIGMIRQVLEKDPNNIDALINLGYFAIKSGQYEKAIERFNRVLEIDSSQIEAYLYLTDVYVSTDQIVKAIESLNSYKMQLEDEVKKQQIEEYIKDLKGNI